MNDLAEKALAGLEVAVRYVRARPTRFLGAAGFALAAATTVAGAAVAAAEPTRPLTTWLGLQDEHTRQTPWPGVIALGALLALAALWIVVLRFVRRTGQPLSRVWSMALAWATPFALGPPLMGTSVYTYAAFGLLQRAGQDPYRSAPADLGDLPVVDAVDPAARNLPSSAGPLGTVVQHLATSIGGGSALGAVIVLRVLAVLAVIAAGRLVVELAGRRRNQALALVILNPLVLLYAVSAARLTIVLAALVLAALLVAQQRRWPLAIGLVCLAGAVSAEALILLPAVLVAHVLARRGERLWRALTQDIAIAAVVIVGLGFAVPDGFGWIRTVGKQFSVHTPFSIAGATSTVLTPFVAGASYDDFAIGGRVTALVAMVCVVVYLLVTTRSRALLQTAAYTMLAVGLFAPVLYPWYLLCGVLLLIPLADPARRVVIVALSAAGCVLMPPGFSDLTSDILTGVLLFVIALLTAVALYARRGGRERKPTTDLSARQRDDSRPTPGHGRDVARLGALGGTTGTEVDAS